MFVQYVHRYQKECSCTALSCTPIRHLPVRWPSTRATPATPFPVPLCVRASLPESGAGSNHNARSVCHVFNKALANII